MATLHSLTQQDLETIINDSLICISATYRIKRQRRKPQSAKKPPPSRVGNLKKDQVLVPWRPAGSPPNKRWGSQLAVDLTRSLAHEPRVCCGFWQKCATLWLLSELSAHRGRYWSRKPSLVKSGLILQMQSAGPCHRRCVGEGKCELLPVAMHMRVYVPLFVLLSVCVCLVHPGM